METTGPYQNYEITFKRQNYTFLARKNLLRCCVSGYFRCSMPKKRVLIDKKILMPEVITQIKILDIFVFLEIHIYHPF